MSFPDRAPDCFSAHARTEVRVKTFIDGRTQYCYQCLDCGRQVGAWLAKNHPDVLALTERVPFDEAALQAYHDRHRQQFMARHQALLDQREQESAEWWAKYNAYLASPAWRARRDLVMARAGGICEGCRRRPATQVHHLTYDHVREEFLWELVAICDVCHTRYHSKDTDHAA